MYYNNNYINTIRYNQRRCNNIELKKFVNLLSELGIKNGDGYFIRPEQLTDGKGVKAICNGLPFYVYMNDKGIKKIASNEFETIEDARKILRKIIRLSYCYMIIDKDKYVIDKNGNKYERKIGKKHTKMMKKLDTSVIYSNILYDDLEQAEIECNKLNKNSSNFTVVTTVDYWNKAI